MENQPIIIYNTPDGKTRVTLFARDGSVWMNQNQLAELFDTSKQNIGQHIANILEEKELEENSVVKYFFTTAADGKQPNMGLTAWKGNIVRKQDIAIAKNYLTHDEIDTLNRLVVIFLETAELRAKNRQSITMDFWRENVDRLLEFQDKKILQNAGSVTHEAMEQKVSEIYAQFDQRRKTAEAEAADAQDLEELKALEQQIKDNKA